MKFRLCVAMSVATAMLAVPTTAHAEEPPAPTVTWPSVTQIHTSYDYRISVSGLSGTRRYFTDWNGQVGTQILDDGETRVSFPTTSYGEERGRVRILSCAQETMDCLVVAESPEFSLVHTISVSDRTTAYEEHLDAEGAGSAAYSLTPVLSGVRLRWVLTPPLGLDPPHVDPMSRAVASGEIADPAPSGIARYRVPEEVPEGRYDLYLLAEVDRPDFGHAIDWSAGHFVRVDRTTPQVRIVAGKDGVAYPVRDGRGDTLDITVRSDEGVTGQIEFLNSAGRVVDVIRGVGNPYGGSDRAEWRAMQHGGPPPARPFPEGVYTARFTAADRAGHVATASVPVGVSHATYRDRSIRLRISAKDSLLDQAGGRCVRVSSPGSRGGRESLGYVTNARCSTYRQSFVSTLHGVYIPELEGATRKKLQISAYSGAGRGDARGRARLRYLSPRDKDEFQTTLGSQAGRYSLRKVNLAPQLYDATKRRPYVLWVVDVGPGRRYDVQSFGVTIHFQVFE